MKIEELNEKLNDLGISINRYSLDGHLNFDTIILYKNYNEWLVFYLDERGNRIDEKKFYTESESCHYIYNLFQAEKNIEQKFKIKI